MTRVLRLPEEAYESSFILGNAFEHVNWLGAVALSIIVILALISGFRAWRWDQLDAGQQIKWFVLFLAALMAWFLSTLPFNLFFNQGYALDKIVVLGLLVLLFWRPIFVVPFLIVSFLVFWQLTQPAINNGSHLAHKLQVFHVLNLFAAWLLLHAVAGKQRATEFLLLTACLIASAYWAPAVKKFMIGWLYSGELYTMPLNAYAHGWLSFLEPHSIVKSSALVAKFDLPMRIFVFAIEAGCVFFLWRRWYALVLLASLTLFHFGVFLLFGYLFWTWIALNIAFMVLLIKLSESDTAQLFNRVSLILAMVLIVTGKYWCSPASLAWIDGRLSYTYRYDVVGESGISYQLPFNYFEPYGDVFTMANFSYLVQNHNMVANPYGSTSRTQADALQNAVSLSDVEGLENSMGWSSYNAERRERFERFVAQFVKNVNRSTYNDPLGLLRPPRQFWTQARGNVYSGQEPIATVIVKEVTTLFDGVELNEIRNNVIMRITIE